MKMLFKELAGLLLLFVATNGGAQTRYVDCNNPNPAPPYIAWATAAVTIQDAVDAAGPGDTVLVNDCVYATGGRTAGTNVLFNRVLVDKALTLRSVNGPSVTVIQGGGSIGTSAVRCVYLTNGAALIGFTLTMGATGTNRNLISGESAGGGVWCTSPNAVLSNCVVTGNAAHGDGGGGYRGTWNNCTITSNSAYGAGGVSSATLNNCTLIANSARTGGGGTSQSKLNNCTLIGNSAYDGGGNWAGALTNCTLMENRATNGGASGAGILVECTLSNNWAELGGATSFGTLINCLIISNSAFGGGGIYESVLTNCILAGNVAAFSTRYNNGGHGGGAHGGTLNNCTVVGNAAFRSLDVFGHYSRGGGAYWTVLNNCTLKSNSATYGGGAYSAAMTNCTLTGNFAQAGGGAALGTLNNCVLTSNLASGFGGATDGATLNRCTISGNVADYGSGGGVSFGVANYCIISHNSASEGGGAYWATLNNCVLYANSAASGGGAYNGMLDSCTLAANVSTHQGGGFNGPHSGTMTNCIVQDNTAPWGPNYLYGTLNYCCTTPLPVGGEGNFTSAPLFVDVAGGNLRLQPNSPCINAGRSAWEGLMDFDGDLRVVGGTVDVGAYEFQSPSSVISYQWLQLHNLPTDGSADFADFDRDGMDNRQEWRAGTDPIDGLSVLEILSMSPPGITVRWRSVSGVTYFLDRATDLSSQPSFSSVASNIAGQAGTTTYMDTNTIGAGPFFYRVGVR